MVFLDLVNIFRILVIIFCAKHGRIDTVKKRYLDAAESASSSPCNNLYQLGRSSQILALQVRLGRPSEVDVTLLISLSKLWKVLYRVVFELEWDLSRNIEESIRKVILEPLANFDKLLSLYFLISIHLGIFVGPKLLVHI